MAFPIDPSQHSAFRAYGGHRPQSVQLSETSTASNSELGQVAQDVGSVITKWQSSLNDALNQWMSDITDMQDLINTVNETLPILEKMITFDPYGYYGPGGGYQGITASAADAMVGMMKDLGIPTDQIQIETNNIGGYYFTPSDIQTDISLTVEYLQPYFSGISTDQQNETQDLMKVMFCYNAVKMNEESLTGLLQTLTSISQNLLQNAGA